MSKLDQTTPEKDWLFNIVKRRYCDGLTEDEMYKVREGVGKVFDAAKALAAIELNSTIEPRSIFVPFSEEGEDRA